MYTSGKGYDLKTNNREYHNSHGRRKRKKKKTILNCIKHYFIFFQFVVILLLCSLLIFTCTKSVAKESSQGVWDGITHNHTKTNVQETDSDTFVDQNGVDQKAIIDRYPVVSPLPLTRIEAVQRIGSLAENYPEYKKIVENQERLDERLLIALANNPEMISFAEGYLNDEDFAKGNESVLGLDHTGDSILSEEEQNMERPLLLQWDKRWGYKAYGASNIGLSGCGPTCVSMAVIALTGDTECTPDVVAEYSMKNGYYVEGVGTSWSLITEGTRHFGVAASELSLEENSWKNAIDHGSVIIASLRRGDFTVNGHFIMIYGYDQSGFCVNDPNSVLRSNKCWTYEKLQGQIKNMWEMKKASDQSSEQYWYYIE